MSQEEMIEVLLDRIEALARGKANLETKIKHLNTDNARLRHQLGDLTAHLLKIHVKTHRKLRHQKSSSQ